MTRRIQRALRVVALTALVAMLCAGVTVGAHEAGTTRVTITITPDRRYDVEVITDAASLAEKLAAVADAPFPSGLSASALERAITAADGDFRERVTLDFDGTSVRPEISVVVQPAADITSVPAATIHFSGPIPAAAGAMTWHFGWTFAAYQLTVRHGTDAGTPRVVDSNEAATHIALATPTVPASHRLEDIVRVMRLGFDSVPNNAMHMLFVLGIFLLSARTRTPLRLLAVLAVSNICAIGVYTATPFAISPELLASLVALSIAGVALLTVLQRERTIWLAPFVFAFGLVHALELARGIGSIDVSTVGRITASLAFDAGVSLGQATIIAAAFVLIGWGWSRREWYYARVIVPASALLACSAVCFAVADLL